MEASRPTWAEVSLSRLNNNFRNIQQHLGKQVEVCAVVKCDGYGHGASECARSIADAGAQWFAVSSPEEGVALRESGIRQRILVMGSFYREQARTVVEHQLTPNIWEDEQIDYLSHTVGATTQFPIHVEVDTGMSRQGVPTGRVQELLQKIYKISNLKVEGIFQHYAAGERIGNGSPAHQEEAFARVIDAVRQIGITPKYVHMANSSGSVGRRHIFGDPRFSIHGSRHLVRCGISLYGYCLPLENNDPGIQNWQNAPVLSWKTRIVSLRHVPAGVGVGYSGAYTTTRPTRIASLPVGYGDGLNRMLSSRGQVIVRGSFAPIIGNISMDMTLIDVTDVPGASIGDEVVLIGKQGSAEIDAWEHASLCGTIPYEILCNIGPRVPRVYL
jgi:alanine racemase